MDEPIRPAPYNALQALRLVARNVPTLFATISDKNGPLFSCSWSAYGAVENVAMLRVITREALTQALSDMADGPNSIVVKV